MYPCKHTKCPLLSISLIPLTKGKHAIVDTEDYEWLSQWKWQTMVGVRTFYARRAGRTKGRQVTVQMGREIAKTKSKDQVDHKNGHGLDNRKCNLRNCTRLQNSYNRPKRARSKSLYKGVYWNNKGWSVCLRKDGVCYRMGTFKIEKEAGLAYNAKATELFGDFARLNLI